MLTEGTLTVLCTAVLTVNCVFAWQKNYIPGVEIAVCTNVAVLLYLHF
jgi:hypothetical protein